MLVGQYAITKSAVSVIRRSIWAIGQNSSQRLGSFPVSLFRVLVGPLLALPCGEFVLFAVVAEACHWWLVPRIVDRCSEPSEEFSDSCPPSGLLLFVPRSDEIHGTGQIRPRTGEKILLPRERTGSCLERLFGRRILGLRFASPLLGSAAHRNGLLLHLILAILSRTRFTETTAVRTTLASLACSTPLPMHQWAPGKRLLRAAPLSSPSTAAENEKA